MKRLPQALGEGLQNNSKGFFAREPEQPTALRIITAQMIPSQRKQFRREPLIHAGADSVRQK